MDAKTLEALKASIRKWEKNARVRKPENFLTGVRDCKLCHLFHDRFNDGNACSGCPVETAGYPWCEDTPYSEAVDAYRQWLFSGSTAAKEVAHAAARKEVAFLKSLLPEGESV